MIMRLGKVNGNSLYLNAFHCAGTYSGVLFGHPDYEENLQIVQSQSMEPLWGKRKTHIIRPAEALLKTLLPRVVYHAWLHGNPVGGENCDGAQLVLIWFGNEEPEKSIKNIVTEQVQGLDWEALAENYFY